MAAREQDSVLADAIKSSVTWEEKANTLQGEIGKKSEAIEHLEAVLSKSKATEEKLEDRNGEVISLRDKYAEMQADLQERIATLTTGSLRRNGAMMPLLTVRRSNCRQQSPS